MGRFPVLTILSDLDVPALICILTHATQCAHQTVSILVRDRGGDASIDRGGGQGGDQTSGGDEVRWRALRTVLEDVMLDLMYDVPDIQGVKSIVITGEVIAGIGQPQIIT